jgi:hypothetical protein
MQILPIPRIAWSENGRYAIKRRAAVQVALNGGAVLRLL